MRFLLNFLSTPLSLNPLPKACKTELWFHFICTASPCSPNPCGQDVVGETTLSHVCTATTKTVPAQPDYGITAAVVAGTYTCACAGGSSVRSVHGNAGGGCTPVQAGVQLVNRSPLFS